MENAAERHSDILMKLNAFIFSNKYEVEAGNKCKNVLESNSMQKKNIFGNFVRNACRLLNLNFEKINNIEKTYLI